MCNFISRWHFGSYKRIFIARVSSSAVNDSCLSIASRDSGSNRKYGAKSGSNSSTSYSLRVESRFFTAIQTSLPSWNLELEIFLELACQPKPKQRLGAWSLELSSIHFGISLPPPPTSANSPPYPSGPLSAYSLIFLTVSFGSPPNLSQTFSSNATVATTSPIARCLGSCGRSNNAER